MAVRAGQSNSSVGPNRSQLRKVIGLITSADYELGCAAREAELAGAVTLSATLTNLMQECVNLREGVRAQIGDSE